MTKALRAVAEENKENNKSDDSDDDDDDDDDDSSSGSSEEQEDHQQRVDNSDEENDDVCEQDAHIDNDDKENEERPIGANNDEWKADREVHQEVSKTIKDIQEEEGEALPMLEEFAPWYPEEEEAEKPTK